MSGEIQASYEASRTLDAIVRDRNGRPYSSSGAGGFGTYTTFEYPEYAIAMTEQGTASAFYTGDFPAVAAGVYSVCVKARAGASPAETDPTVAQGDLHWDGSNAVGLSELATSGQVSRFAPQRVARGTMLQNFPFKMVSSADHVTPFVSGVISGQISRDGGAFGPLQSGAFSETGHGWYRVTLTSGDLLADTAALVFTGAGISGGQADQRDLGLILQRASGY